MNKAKKDEGKPGVCIGSSEQRIQMIKSERQEELIKKSFEFLAKEFGLISTGKRGSQRKIFSKDGQNQSSCWKINLTVVAKMN